MAITTSSSKENTVPDNVAHFRSLNTPVKDTTIIAARKTVLKMVNLPYFVFVMKVGRMEKTSLSEVSVITAQCRTKWIELAKRVRTAIRNIYFATVSPKHLFLLPGKQASTPDGPVT